MALNFSLSSGEKQERGNQSSSTNFSLSSGGEQPANAPSPRVDYETALARSEDAAADAEDYAFATSSFTDNDGNSYDKGAKGFLQELKNDYLTSTETGDKLKANVLDLSTLSQEIQVLRAALFQLQMEWTEVTKSGDGSQTVFQLSHSLGAVPGLAQVQERSSEAAKEFYVSDRTSNYVEVTFDQSPPNGTDNLISGLLVGLAE